MPYRIEVGDALFQTESVEIGDTGLDGFGAPVEALVGLCDALVQFGQVLEAARGGNGVAPGPLPSTAQSRRCFPRAAQGARPWPHGSSQKLLRKHAVAPRHR
ncbi:MAG: hypothetical protein ACP5QR_08975 [Rhizomicrobium sp.]